MENNLAIKNHAQFVRQCIVYQMFLRAFTPEGTLAAATRHLEEVAATGADVVYLVPFVEADDDAHVAFWSERQRKSGCENPRSPYRLMDYRKVDPEYGTDEDLRTFIARAHAFGMRVVFDLVYFHAGPTFATRHPELVKCGADGRPELGPWHFPILDFDKPALREHLWGNMVEFVRDFGCDGFRCDVGGEVSLDFWEEGRRRIEAIKPEVLMIDEAEEKRPEDQRYAFDVDYGFSICFRLADVLEGRAGALWMKQAWEARRAAVSPRALFLNCFDNHDVANDAYDNRPEKAWGREAVDAALALCYALDGVPMLYNGIEFADANRHSIFAKPGQGLGIDRSRGLDAERLALLQALGRLRRALPALHAGETEWILPEAGDAASRVVHLRRQAGGQIVNVYINLSAQPQSLALDLRTAAACLATSRRAESHAERLTLRAYGFAFFVA